MAKSEKQAAVEETQDEGIYDAEETLDEDLSALPEESEIFGRWVVQCRGGKRYHGKSVKGPWSQMVLFLVPIEPAGGGPEGLTRDELPQLKHRMFYTSVDDKRRFVELAAKFGVGAGMREQMLEEMKGATATAFVKLGTDNKGNPEYKLSAFREEQAIPERHGDEIPF